jgi:hypothetical protein
MIKLLRYVLGLVGAVVVAFILFLLTQDMFGFSEESVVINSLATAGMLSLMLVFSAGPRK